MFSAIDYSLRRLFDFRGRDRRATFWWFMLAVQMFLVLLALVALFSLPDSLGHAEIVSFGLFFTVVTVLLMAGSVVRRLHDSGLSGWIAVIPAAIHLAVIVPALLTYQDLMAEAALDAEAPLSQQLLDWLPYIIVMIIGVLPSTPGPNRFGEGSR